MKAISTALVSALAEIEGVAKDKINPAFKSKYADLASALDAVRPVFAKHSLAVTQETEPSNEGVIVETVVLHSSGEERRFGKLFLPANKRDAQGFGSALTYAKRYSLLTALGIPTEDDDGNAAVKSAPRPDSTTIDEAQFANLTLLLEQSGSDVRRFCDYYQIPAVRALPASRYDSAVRSLKAKLTTQPEMAK